MTNVTNTERIHQWELVKENFQPRAAGRSVASVLAATTQESNERELQQRRA